MRSHTKVVPDRLSHFEGQTEGQTDRQANYNREIEADDILIPVNTEILRLEGSSLKGL